MTQVKCCEKQVSSVRRRSMEGEGGEVHGGWGLWGRRWEVGSAVKEMGEAGIKAREE